MKQIPSRYHIWSTRFAVLLGALLTGLFPQRVLAGCGPTDPRACMDNGYHILLVGWLEVGWLVNRMLLLSARWMEGFRVWLVGDVLGTAFDMTIAGLWFPLWIIAGIAWCVYCVGYFVQAFVDMQLVNVKRGFIYLVFAWVLFTSGSEALAQLQQFRAVVSQGIGALGGDAVLAATQELSFYTTADGSMALPRSVYGPDAAADACPGIDVARETDALYLLDYAATFLWATAQDISCPTVVAGQPSLPEGFARGWRDPETNELTFQGYVYRFPIDNEPPAARADLLRLARAGGERMMLGLGLSLGAFLEQGVHLMFDLALATLFFGLILACLVVLFTPMEYQFRQQIAGIWMVFQASTITAIWLFLFMSVMYLAALSGNQFAVGVAGIFILLSLCWHGWKALSLLLTSFDTAGAVMGMTPSTFMQAAGRVVTDGTLLAGAVATGGGSAVLTMALRRGVHQLGSSAVGHAAGRVLGQQAAGTIQDHVRSSAEAHAVMQEDRERQWYHQHAQSLNAGPYDIYAQRRQVELQLSQMERQQQQLHRAADNARARQQFSSAIASYADARDIAADMARLQKQLRRMP